MVSGQEREQLDARARQGETVVPGGTGGKTLEAQEHLAQGRSRGGHTRKEQLGTEGYQEMGHRGGENRREQMGTEGVPGDGPERGPQHQQQVWRGVRGGRDQDRRVQIQNQE